MDSNHKLIRYIYPNDCFGEYDFIISKKKSNFTIKSKTESTYLIIYKNDSKNLLKNKVISKRLNKLLFIRHNKIHINNFYLYSYLGRMNYSTSFYIHDKINIFKLKIYQKKDLINNQKLMQHIYNEKIVSLSVDGQNFSKGITTYKDKDNYYLLSEYIKGQNFKEFLSMRNELLNELEIQFYFANIINIIEYLHYNRIIHRNIQPSSFILNTSGYLQLNEYLTCKIINNKNNRTNTIVGCPYYMSPEIIKGLDYTFSSDFWTLGVCLFELTYGYYPFGNFV